MSTWQHHVNRFAPRERTLSNVLKVNAAHYADKVLIESVDGERITYAELDDRANQLAHGLDGAGVEHQELVLVMLNDGIELVGVYCGLARRGAVQVPINLAYRGAFLSRLINDSRARVLIVDAAFLDRLVLIIDELEFLERLFVRHEATEPSPIPEVLFARFDIHTIDELYSDRSIEFENKSVYSEMIGVMYTSGTTGASKGVMVSHAQAYRYAAANADSKHLLEDDRYYTSGLPFFHIAGQWGVFYATLICGATVVLRRGYRNDFFWRDVREHKATVVFLLGAIANFLWQQPEREDDADNPLRQIGMYPVIPQYQAFAKRFDVHIGTGYGSTEMGGTLQFSGDEPFPNNQCVGYPLDGFQVAILDENDEPCAPHQVGQICVRSENPWEIMIGYWRRPEATTEAFRNLWFHSGDAGYCDEQGRFYFADRLGDSMRRRGENISSMEVEDVVNQHESVLECAAFPVWADSEQEVMVAVVKKPNKTIDPAQFIAFLAERMPYFAVPRYLDWVESIPKTPTGKIQKIALRERGVSDTTWDRVAAGVRLQR